MLPCRPATYKAPTQFPLSSHFETRSCNTEVIFGMVVVWKMLCAYEAGIPRLQDLES